MEASAEARPFKQPNHVHNLPGVRLPVPVLSALPWQFPIPRADGDSGGGLQRVRDGAGGGAAVAWHCRDTEEAVEGEEVRGQTTRVSVLCGRGGRRKGGTTPLAGAEGQRDTGLSEE